MQCKICNKNYRNLGVHVQKKHMPCDDYKREFNIPLTTPLMDADLRELFSVSASQRLENPAWREQCMSACAANSKAVKGKKLGPRDLPPASKKHLIEMNKKTGESYRQHMAPIVRVDYMAGLTPMEIHRKHGVCGQTLRDWVRAGLLPARRRQYVFEQPDEDASAEVPEGAKAASR